MAILSYRELISLITRLNSFDERLTAIEKELWPRPAPIELDEETKEYINRFLKDKAV